MTIEHPKPSTGGTERWGAGASEFVVAGLLGLLGVTVLLEATQINDSLTNTNTLGPRTVPYAVGGLLVAVALALTADIAYGGRGSEEEGEDVDLARGTDWRTLICLAALIGGAAYLFEPLGFPLAGGLLFLGVARLLGSRRLALDLLVSFGVSTAVFLLFSRALGIALPSGLVATWMP